MSYQIERVDDLFTEWDRQDSPGCALAVIQDGSVVYARGYGMANLEHGVPIKPETVFDLGSTSKQFTALCILLLARQGKLLLDDPLQKYVPEIPEYDTPITIRHLVHHTSGLRDYLTLMALANMPFENDYQEAEVVALIARQKALNFTPGDEHLYCNSGYFLMSEIVERVSGLNLREYAEEHIFSPLGMQHTHFHNNFKEIVTHRASGYSPKDEGGFEIDMGIFDVLGDGGLYTSVLDLYLWDQNYYANQLDGGGQELIEQMEQVGELNSGEKLKYAFGLMVNTYRGLKAVSHGGSWYGYRAQMLRFPEQRFSVICLSNLGSFNPEVLCKKVADIYLENQFLEEGPEPELAGSAKEVELALDVLLEKCGLFEETQTHTVAELLIGEEGLEVEAMGLKFKLAARSQDHFFALNAPVTLNLFFEAENKTLVLDINDGYQQQTYQRIETPAFSPEDLQEYAGCYHSPELNVTYQFILVNGELKLLPEMPLFKYVKLTKKDVFNLGLANLKFLRGEENKISGFSIDAGRVKDIRFERIEN